MNTTGRTTVDPSYTISRRGEVIDRLNEYRTNLVPHQNQKTDGNGRLRAPEKTRELKKYQEVMMSADDSSTKRISASSSQAEGNQRIPPPIPFPAVSTESGEMRNLLCSKLPRAATLLLQPSRASRRCLVLGLIDIVELRDMRIIEIEVHLYQFCLYQVRVCSTVLLMTSDF